MFTSTAISSRHEEWNRTFGWIGDESGEYAYALPNGFMLVGKGGCGVWLVRTNTKGNVIDSHYFKGATTITKTSEGNAIAGHSGKIWLIETDNFGKRKWGTFIEENFLPRIKQSRDGYFIYGIEGQNGIKVESKNKTKKLKMNLK